MDVYTAGPGVFIFQSLKKKKASHQKFPLCFICFCTFAAELGELPFPQLSRLFADA